MTAVDSTEYEGHALSFTLIHLLQSRRAVCKKEKRERERDCMLLDDSASVPDEALVPSLLPLLLLLGCLAGLSRFASCADGRGCEGSAFVHTVCPLWTTALHPARERERGRLNARARVCALAKA